MEIIAKKPLASSKLKLIVPKKASLSDLSFLQTLGKGIIFASR